MVVASWFLGTEDRSGDAAAYKPCWSSCCTERALVQGNTVYCGCTSDASLGQSADVAAVPGT